MGDSTNLPEVNINAIATDLNGKADTDLTNVTDTGYIKMASASMPSDKYIILTLGASGVTYTAPANGYFMLFMSYGSGADAYYDMYNASNVLGFRHYFATPVAEGRSFIPVKKGDLMRVDYNGTPSFVDFRFIYALGQESEAS